MLTEELLKVEDVRKILKISRSQVYALVHRDDFPSLQLGRRGIRVPRTALEAWIEKQMNRDEPRDG